MTTLLLFLPSLPHCLRNLKTNNGIILRLVYTFSSEEPESKLLKVMQTTKIMLHFCVHLLPAVALIQNIIKSQNYHSRTSDDGYGGGGAGSAVAVDVTAKVNG